MTELQPCVVSNLEPRSGFALATIRPWINNFHSGIGESSLVQSSKFEANIRPAIDSEVSI